jgi:hypothetical protein
MTIRHCLAALLVCLVLASASLAMAQARTMDSRSVDRGSVQYGLRLEYNTICVEGYKYLFVFHARPRGDYPFSGLTQMFQERDGKSVPIPCR